LGLAKPGAGHQLAGLDPGVDPGSAGFPDLGQIASRHAETDKPHWSHRALNGRFEMLVRIIKPVERYGV
jgi:hypothetical protein